MTDLAAQFVKTLTSQLGYASNNYQVSKYGKASSWRSPWLWGAGWDGYWCNRYLSWGIDKTLGSEAGRAAIGQQAGTPLPVGFAATWLQREWFLANDRWVGFDNARPGDFVLFKLPGRPTNPTNHIGAVIENRGRTLLTIEGNLRRPGGGPVGVWYHERRVTDWVVAVYRPDWTAAAATLGLDTGAETGKPTPPKPAPQEDDVDLTDPVDNLRGAAKDKFGPYNTVADLLGYGALSEFTSRQHGYALARIEAALSKAAGTDPKAIARELEKVIADDIAAAVREAIADLPGRDAGEIADAVVAKIGAKLGEA